MKEVKKIIYMSEDNKEFDDREECLEYDFTNNLIKVLFKGEQNEINSPTIEFIVKNYNTIKKVRDKIYGEPTVSKPKQEKQILNESTTFEVQASTVGEQSSQTSTPTISEPKSSIPRDERNGWIETAKEKEYKFILVVYDSHVNEYYPDYCEDEKIKNMNSRKYIKENFQEIVEVIEVK